MMLQSKRTDSVGGGSSGGGGGVSIPGAQLGHGVLGGVCTLLRFF